MTRGPRTTLHWQAPGMSRGWTACGLEPRFPRRRIRVRSVMRLVTCKHCRSTAVFKYVLNQAKLEARDARAEGTRRYFAMVEHGA